MKTKNKKGVIVTFGIVALVLFIGVMYQGQPEPEWQIGDRGYSPEKRAYGTVGDIFEPFDMIDICYDKGYCQQSSLSNPGLIKWNNSKYMEIDEFPIYPSPVLGWYAESFKPYHAHPPINDIQSYCIEVYGNYRDRFTCYTKTDVEMVYYPISALDVTVWKWQKILDTKSNINKTVAKSRKVSQNYGDYDPINHSLLKSWMGYYGMTYNNRSLAIDDFNEIKSNELFMTKYCSVYGYAGYDRKEGCYRVLDTGEKA